LRYSIKTPHPYFNSYVYGLTSLSNLLRNTHLKSYDYGLNDNRFDSRDEALKWYNIFFRRVDKDVQEYNKQQEKDGHLRLNPLPQEIYVIESYHLIVL
jgi:hypothetical protein